MKDKTTVSTKPKTIVEVVITSLVVPAKRARLPECEEFPSKWPNVKHSQVGLHMPQQLIQPLSTQTSTVATGPQDLLLPSPKNPTFQNTVWIPSCGTSGSCASIAPSPLSISVLDPGPCINPWIPSHRSSGSKASIAFSPNHFSKPNPNP